MKLNVLYENERDGLSNKIKKKGYDQEDVADIIGVDPSTISRHISGIRDPSFDTLEQYAKILGSGVLTDFGLASSSTEKKRKKRRKG